MITASYTVPMSAVLNVSAYFYPTMDRHQILWGDAVKSYPPMSVEVIGHGGCKGRLLVRAKHLLPKESTRRLAWVDRENVTYNPEE